MDSTAGKLFGIIGPSRPVISDAAARTAAISLAAWKTAHGRLGRKLNMRCGI
jgi:hypothetical protein